MELSTHSSISTILEQLSSICCIESSSLQIRNGHEYLSDESKKLNEYKIEDHSNFLVIRGDILDEHEEQETKKNDDSKDCNHDNDDNNDNQEMDNTDDIHSELPSIKSPILPSVPNNSFHTESQIATKQSEGLYSKLE
eukprot:39111_1